MQAQPVSLILGVLLLIFPFVGWSQQDTTLITQSKISEIKTLTVPAEMMAPSGTVKLKRLGRSTFQIHNKLPGDTLVIELFSKHDIPLKFVRLFAPNGQLDSMVRNGSVFNFRFPVPDINGLTLEIKAPFRCKRVQAELKTLRHPFVLPDTFFLRHDTIHQSNAFGSQDTMISTYQLLGGKDSLLHQKSVKVGENGQVIRRQLIIDTSIHQASSRLLSPQGQVRLRRFAPTYFTYTDFSRGDTLLFQIESKSKQPLKSVGVFNDRGEYIGGAIEVEAFQHSLVVQDEKRIDLVLRAIPGRKRKLAEVKVMVQPPLVMTQTLKARDSIFQIQEEVLYDTLLLTLADVQSSIAPILNLEGRSLQAVDISIPLVREEQDNLMKIAFWFGLDYRSVEAYTLLEETVPPDWAQPGVPVAVAAYGSGYPINLPRLQHADVEFFVLNPSQLARFNQGSTQLTKRYSFENSRQNYGTLNSSFFETQGISRERDPITGSLDYRFFLCFKNKNTINSYPLAIKVVGYYRKVKEIRQAITFLKTSTTDKL